VGNGGAVPPTARRRTGSASRCGSRVPPLGFLLLKKN
jgi:hypothetical protein